MGQAHSIFVDSSDAIDDRKAIESNPLAGSLLQREISQSSLSILARPPASNSNL